MPTAADLAEKLSTAAEKLVELRIVTVIGDAAVGLDAAQKLQLTGLTSTAAYVTSIDLLQGDIWTSTSVAVPEEQRSGLRAYHDQMVQKGQEIVARNLSLLKDVVEFLDKRG